MWGRIVLAFVAAGLIQFVVWPVPVFSDERPNPPPFPFDHNTAQEYQRQYAQWARLPLEVENALGMKFVLVPPGTFSMGSPPDEPDRKDDEQRHQVTLTRPLYLSRTEVTVGQFRQFVAAAKRVTDGQRNGGGHAHDALAEWKHRPGTSWLAPGFAGPFEMRDDHPVVHVSHADSLAFCRWMDERAPIATIQQAAYRLPTEAEWEWACRAGSGGRFSWGGAEDTTGRVANVGDRTLLTVHPRWPRRIMPMDDGFAFPAPVGSFRPNAFGLHDMLGNVWEFCGTRAGEYPKDPVIDPLDLDPRRGFAVRGGGWSNMPADVRCATRNADPPHFCHSNLGFRVAMAAPVRARQQQVLDGLRRFYLATARPDGSFQPGVDQDYQGMSDSAYSDLAAVTYAVTIHKTFGWKLPHEEQTVEWLLARQNAGGEFFNVGGTVDPKSAEGRVYNTTQALVALHALGKQPRFDPLPVFEDILREDYKTLPAYSTSFFPLAYLCAGRPIPAKADQGIRALMIQDETGYLNDHVAATFHASHYYRLVGEPTPKSREMVARMLRDQKADGSWMLNMPSRDRHATFDAVFALVHEGGGRDDCRLAIERAADWALTCANEDGGFAHYPGGTSDADAVYFQVGTLVMADRLEPARPLPPDPHLLSWGHLMPRARRDDSRSVRSLQMPAWVGAVAFDAGSPRLAIACADHRVRIVDVEAGRELALLAGHDDIVSAVAFQPGGNLLASGGFDRRVRVWDSRSAKIVRELSGHRGAVTSVAFSPNGKRLVTASLDGGAKVWDVESGQNVSNLVGHKSWVNSVAYSADGQWIVTGGSDGQLILWSAGTGIRLKDIAASNTEVRSIAICPNGRQIAAGLRYGSVKVWNTETWQPQLDISAHAGDTWSVAFSADGRQLFTGGGDWNRGGLVKCWDLDSGRLVRSWQHTGEVLSVAVAPDGQSVAAGGGDKTVKVWPVSETKEEE